MSLTSKPLWARGMFMRPQHFQQQDRHLAAGLKTRTEALRPAPWGIRELSFDRGLLGTGKLAIERCVALMPDGTVVRVPEDAEPPNPLDLARETRNRLVRLGVPVHVGDGVESVLEEGAGHPARYLRREVKARDVNDPNADRQTIAVGQLNLRLLLDGEAQDDFVTLPIARVRDVDSGINLDPTFAPPVLDLQAAPALLGMVREVEALLQTRGDAVAAQTDPLRNQGEASALLDFLLLQTINRHQPPITHLLAFPGIHPEIVYRQLLMLAGELGSFVVPRRRAAPMPRYDHADLAACFRGVVEAIRLPLSNVQEQGAIALPLQAARYGISVSPITDRSLIETARFILSVSADVHPETLRSRAPTQFKIGPVEEIRNLVNLQLPGIELEPLPVVPREIPYRSAAVYLELKRSGDFWAGMARSAAFALHVSGDYPGLRMEFWALPGG